jgi:hypothetical protein
MDDVVWNTDVRFRPELEVEIDILVGPDDIPGEHHALLCAELEVELAIASLFDEHDAWFLDDDAILEAS